MNMVEQASASSVLRQQADGPTPNGESNPPRGLSPLPAIPGQGIHGVDHLRQLLEKERARTDRSGCEFALVVFGNNNNGNGNGGDGGLRAGSLLISRLAAQVRRRARGTDEVGYSCGPFVCALLTGTSAAGGWRFAEDVAAAMGTETSGIVCGVYSYPSAWITPDVESLASLRMGTSQIDAGHANGNSNGNGNGNGNGNANGNGNGNGNGHANANGNGNGNGNGNANGNGNGHATRDTRVYSLVTSGEGDAAAKDGAAAAVAAALVSEGHPISTSRIPLVPNTVAIAPIPVNGPLQVLFARPAPAWKRCLDVLGATVGLIVLAPVMLLLAVGVKLTSRGPVIFQQIRAGQGGRPFVLYKFRSMRLGATAQQDKLRSQSEQDGPAFKMRRDPRVTRFGRFIRKTSLDELPQLWNVLKGDMSLVGPRPLPWAEACGCEPWQRRRLDVLPGITCVWQVEGRSRVGFAQWMRMDIAYIRSRSLLRDVWLLVRTIPAVIFRRGAS